MGGCTKIEHDRKWSINSVKMTVTKIISVVKLAPLNKQRINATERAICTFKNNFVAGLVWVDRNLTINLWCQIVKQAEITMNLLQTSRTNPRLLEHAQIFGTFDFNVTPMENHWERKSLHTKNHTKNQINVIHVENMEYRDGISAQHWNTIDVTIFFNRNKISNNFWRSGIPPAKCENANSLVCWYLYTSSAQFSGIIKEANAKLDVFNNKWYP